MRNIIEQHTEKEHRTEKASPETYRLKLPVGGVFYGSGLMGSRIPLSGRGLTHYQRQIQAFLHDIGGAMDGTFTDNGGLLEGDLAPEMR